LLTGLGQGEFWRHLSGNPTNQDLGSFIKWGKVNQACQFRKMIDFAS
jgi:hypothetical protein